MTSLQTSTRQVDNHNGGFYIPIGDIRTQIFGYTAATSTFSTCQWAAAPANAAEGQLSSLVASAGAGLLKDMGKTIIGTATAQVGVTYRKVQLVVPASLAPSTFGVGGRANTSNDDYCTGYIVMGFEGGQAPTKVAKYGR